MIINTNVTALNTLRQLNINTNAQAKSMAKLSSGLRINSASDDAAGLAISEKMKGQIRGLDQASRNAQDAQSLGQTAEGALSQTTDILQRMRELATQSASDTNTSSDRGNIQQEVDQLAKEITRISNTTEFNTQNLLAGGLNDTFQIGANAGQNITLNIGAMDAKSLGVSGDIITTSFTGTNTGVSSISNVSNGLDGYKVKTLSTSAAATGSVTPSNGSGGTGSVTGTYAGSTDKTFVVKIGSVDANGNALTASYSTDGGNTFTNAAVDSTAGTSSNVTLSDGLTMNIVANAANVANNTYTFSQTAEYKEVELATSADVAVGSAVKVYNNMSGTTIGNAATGQTADISFNYASLTASAADTISQSSTASTAAVIGSGGQISQQAVTQKGIDVSSQSSANLAITVIDKAIQTVSNERAKLGAFSNRLDNTVNNLNTSSQNISDAQSRIADVDMAKEMMNQSKSSVLAQAAQAMLAQANQQPQQVLQLLRG